MRRSLLPGGNWRGKHNSLSRGADAGGVSLGGGGGGHSLGGGGGLDLVGGEGGGRFSSGLTRARRRFS